MAFPFIIVHPYLHSVSNLSVAHLLGMRPFRALRHRCDFRMVVARSSKLHCWLCPRGHLKYMRVLALLICCLLAEALPATISHAECPNSSPDPDRILCEPVTPPVAPRPGLASPGQSDSASGNFATSIQIGDLPIPIQYNSQDPVTTGPFGARMTFLGSLSVINNSAGAVAFDTSLNLGDNSGGILLIDGAGTRFRFTKDGDKWTHPYSLQGEISFIERNPSGAGYQLVDDNGTKVTYEAGYVGKFYPSKIIEPNGLTTSIEYRDGLPTRISLPEGKAWTLTYNSEGRLAQVKDAFARITTLEYAGNNLVAVRYPGDEGYALGYANATGVNAALLTTIGTRSKHKFEYETEPVIRGAASLIRYYTGGILASHEYQPDVYLGSSSLGRLRTRYTYQGSSVLVEYGRMEPQSDENSRDRIFNSWRSWVEIYRNHPVLGAALSEQRAGNAPSEQNLGIRTGSFTWDQSGRLVSFTDSMGVMSSYTYDQRGLVQSIASASSIVTEIASRQPIFPYSPTEIKVSGSGGLYTRSTYQYDDKFNLTLAVSYDQAGVERVRKTYGYVDGFPTRVLTTSSSSATYDRIYPWRILSTSGAAGAATYEYDPLGVVNKISTALGTTSLRYDYGSSNPTDPLIRTWVESPFMTREFSVQRWDTASGIQTASSSLRSSLSGGAQIATQHQIQTKPDWGGSLSATTSNIAQGDGSLRQKSVERRNASGINQVPSVVSQVDLAPVS
jgi:YD repeat-containing protein